MEIPKLRDKSDRWLHSFTPQAVLTATSHRSRQPRRSGGAAAAWTWCLA
jgi:hypothetical protein